MKQGDLVDNTATFAMIMSFSFTQWTRIAVWVILPNAYQIQKVYNHILTKTYNLMFYLTPILYCLLLSILFDQ